MYYLVENLKSMPLKLLSEVNIVTECLKDIDKTNYKPRPLGRGRGQSVLMASDGQGLMFFS